MPFFEEHRTWFIFRENGHSRLLGDTVTEEVRKFASSVVALQGVGSRSIRSAVAFGQISPHFIDM